MTDTLEVWFLSEVQTHIGPIRSYPPPDEQPNCQCQGSPMRAFFCPTGHMLECHVGMDCATARCSHLLKYADPTVGE